MMHSSLGLRRTDSTICGLVWNGHTQVPGIILSPQAQRVKEKFFKVSDGVVRQNRLENARYLGLFATMCADKSSYFSSLFSHILLMIAEFAVERKEKSQSADMHPFSLFSTGNPADGLGLENVAFAPNR